jgi:AcrR family transcriptional regulator
MKHMKRISPRKEPVQKRSFELRQAILDAATYVLKKDGPSRFTTNRVAERAGVNIASLYQYYPNKESLLFHLVELEWNSTFESIFPILLDDKKNHRERLHLFIQKFYESEIAEGDLREAIGAAGIAIEKTKEYEKLMKKGDKVFYNFLAEALPSLTDDKLKQTSFFIQGVIFGFSEGLESDNVADLQELARTMNEMICNHFKI